MNDFDTDTSELLAPPSYPDIQDLPPDEPDLQMASVTQSSAGQARAQWFWERWLSSNEEPQPREAGWPTQDDVMAHRQNDMTYGTNAAGFTPQNRPFEPKRKLQNTAVIRELSGTQNVIRVLNSRRVEGVPAPMSERQAAYLEESWVAAQRSPLAAYGFEPRQTILSEFKGSQGLTVAGVYSPKDDAKWVDMGHKSVAVHESIHRGFKKLRDAGQLPSLNNWPEETLVRALMLRAYGPVEKGRGNLADEQVGQAEFLLGPKHPRQKEFIKLITDIEQSAQAAIFREKPRGPR